MGNFLLKDSVKKVIFLTPILNTEVSVSEIHSLHKELKDACLLRQSWRGVVPVKLTEGRINSDLAEKFIGTKH